MNKPVTSAVITLTDVDLDTGEVEITCNLLPDGAPNPFNPKRAGEKIAMSHKMAFMALNALKGSATRHIETRIDGDDINGDPISVSW